MGSVLRARTVGGWLVIVSLLASSLVATAAGADPAAELVSRWLAAQNSGDFEAYQALYAESFRGVRTSGGRSVTMDRAQWLEDRRRMFARPMVVEARDVRSRTSGEGIHVELEQTWAAGEYKDVGKKTMLLAMQGDTLRIAREELHTSTRVLLPGQIEHVFIPAKTKEEAEVTRVRFEKVASELRGLRAWPLKVSEDPAGVLVVACDAEGFAGMAETARAIDRRAVAKIVRGASTACPELERSEDSDDRWAWPRIAEARLPGKRSLIVFVTPYTSTDHGDFGRERRGHHVLAALRDESGDVLATLAETAASDFSDLSSVVAAGKKVVVTERYVDAPCDGTDKHAYKRLERVTTFELDPSAPESLRARGRDRTLERGRCDDSGYRQWQQEMNRAR